MINAIHDNYIRFKLVQHWRQVCNSPNALDSSFRWHGCVAARVITSSDSIKGYIEMLSTHILLINYNGVVLFTVDLHGIYSIERRQEIHYNDTDANLTGGTGTVIRTFVELVVYHGAYTHSKDTVEVPNEARGGYRQQGKADQRLKSTLSKDKDLNRTSEHNYMDSGEPVGNDDAKTQRDIDIDMHSVISFVMEGLEGAHFAGAIELLWRRRIGMLSVRELAMCRCSHIRDFIYILSLLPIDVDCVLIQQTSSFISPRRYSMQFSRLSVESNGSFRKSGGSPTTTSEKSAVLRIDQQYMLHIIFRPRGIDESLFSTSRPYVEMNGNDEQATLQCFRTITVFLGDVLIITHTNNNLRIVTRDGRIFVLGDVGTLGANKNNKDQEIRKKLIQKIMKETGFDASDMTLGARHILEIFLYFSSTQHYQNLFLDAISKMRNKSVSREESQKHSLSLSVSNSFLSVSGTESLYSTESQMNNTSRKVSNNTNNSTTDTLLPEVIPINSCLCGNEIYRLYLHYLSLDTNCNGSLSKKDFLSAVGSALIDNDGPLIRSMCHLFDYNKTGVIVFPEYLNGCRVLLRGSLTERVRYLFGVFDTKLQGSIAFQEFLEGMRHVSSVLYSKDVGNQVTYERQELHERLRYNLESFSKGIFDLVDTNRDGFIDFQEFKRGILMNPAIVNSLGGTLASDTIDLCPTAATQSDASLHTLPSPFPASNSVQCVIPDMLDAPRNPNAIVSFGDSKWKEMSLILIGIETSTLSHKVGNSSVLTKLSFQQKEVYDLSLSLEVTDASISSNSRSESFISDLSAQITPMKNMFWGNDKVDSMNNTKTIGKITFNDYNPAVFNVIRLFFGISQESYLQSLGIQQLKDSLLLGTFTCLHDMLSSGRSGSSFYTTHDERFILKSIPVSESKTLRKMLPSYYHHIIKNPNTLLPRFCGLHALFHRGKKLVFVVMQNILLNKVPIETLYDLKGCTVNRTTPMDKRAPGVALKDNDFNNKKIYVTSETKRNLQKQIEADCALLHHNNLTDYSLLLGVHTTSGNTLTRNNTESLCPSASHNIFQRYYGGIRSAIPIEEPSQIHDSCMLGIPHSVTSDKGVYIGSITNSRSVGDDGCYDSDGDIMIDLSQKDNEESEASDLSLDISLASVEVLPGVPEKKSYYAEKSHKRENSTSVDRVNDPKRDSKNQTGLKYEIYFFGIVDTLTVYGLKKKGESFGKSLLHDINKVSCVSPVEYRKRFTEYLESIFEEVS